MQSLGCAFTKGTYADWSFDAFDGTDGSVNALDLTTVKSYSGGLVEGDTVCPGRMSTSVTGKEIEINAYGRYLYIVQGTMNEDLVLCEVEVYCGKSPYYAGSRVLLIDED